MQIMLSLQTKMTIELENSKRFISSSDRGSNRGHQDAAALVAPKLKASKAKSNETASSASPPVAKAQGRGKQFHDKASQDSQEVSRNK